MKRETHNLEDQPGGYPGPDVREPCAWCSELAVVAVHGSTAMLDCSSCGVRVEVDLQPAHQRRPRRPALRAAA